MLTFHANQGVEFCDGLTRRDFMKVGAASAGAVGLTLADLADLRAQGRSSDINCILLFLVGAPSQLDTWDPKPDAPAEVRGPFQPIQTNVTGIQIGEHFPRMARMADKYALIRSVHHKAAPIHETGHQMMQTGYLFRGGQEHPHYGAAVSALKGGREGGLPPYVVVPGPIGNTGVSVSHGQGAGYLGVRHEPLFLQADASANEFKVSDIHGIDPARQQSRQELLNALDRAQRVFDGTEGQARDQTLGLLAEKSKKAFDLQGEPDALRDRYGRNTFGQSCLLARRLLDQGTRLVTVNMFDTVFSEVTWDCHADGGALGVTLNDYKQTLCPMFDLAYTALLEDLDQRGQLKNTLVVAMGEFGRTPRLNARGGRDHWPGVWSILFAGAGVQGGQVVGASDKTGSEPRHRPVTPAQVAASVYHGLGFDVKNTRLPGPDNRPLPLSEAEPVTELFQ